MIHDAFSAGVEPGGLYSSKDIKILICYMLSRGRRTHAPTGCAGRHRRKWHGELF